MAAGAIGSPVRGHASGRFLRRWGSFVAGPSCGLRSALEPESPLILEAPLEAAIGVKSLRHNNGVTCLSSTETVGRMRNPIRPASVLQPNAYEYRRYLLNGTVGRINRK